MSNPRAVVLSKKVTSSVDEWVKQDISEEVSNQNFAHYKRYIFLKLVFIIVCLSILVAVIGYSITVGSTNIGYLETYSIIWNHWFGTISNELKDYIVVDLRMPRIVAGILAGCGLAACGVVMQSTLMNPLADPYTTGVSSGASFGATLAIVANFSIIGGQFAIVGNAFVFSLIPTGVILIVSKMKNASPTTMIMSGIAVMYIFNAVTTVLMLWADPNSMQSVYIWQAGTLSKANWDVLPIMAGATLVGFIIMMLLSRKLNILATGDDSANSLGLNANRLRVLCMILVSLVSATLVSFTGLIGFIGLVAPHIARIFVGSDNRFLIPAAASFGAMLLIVADLIGRTIVSPAILQAGVVMSFLGGPMFLWLIVNKKSKIWG